MPAFLAAPVAKFVAVILLVTGIFVGGYYKGYQSCKQAWDAAIAVQAINSAGTIIKGAENTARVVTKYIKVKGETQVLTQTVEKEVVRYVEAKHPDCTVPNEFEWVWDRAIGLPAPAHTAERTDAGDSSGITTAEVLQAHADYGAAYLELRDRYAALVEWVTTSYAIQKEGAGR